MLKATHLAENSATIVAPARIKNRPEGGTVLTNGPTGNYVAYGGINGWNCAAASRRSMAPGFISITAIVTKFVRLLAQGIERTMMSTRVRTVGPLEVDFDLPRLLLS